ncbi:MAG: alpha-mannosidase [Firmicutes bacterium]|nr:alpha-mannosidase [Bacillota bacterium]
MRAHDCGSTGARIHLVPHCHLDVEWYWPFEETEKRAAVVLSTVLDLMEHFKHLSFAMDQAVLFKAAFEVLGEDERAAIRRLLRDGRFEAVGGMWVQPDVQVPHPEVLVRNIMMGRRWFSENLAADVRCAWNIDVFGQCPQLPQLLARSGFDYIVFWRGVPGQLAKDLPSTFIWRAPDGSGITTHWLSLGYGIASINGLLPESNRLGHRLFYGHRYPIPREPKEADKRQPDTASNIAQATQDLDSIVRRSPLSVALVPVGGDNFIPSEDVLDLPELLAGRAPGQAFAFSTPSGFFAAIDTAASEGRPKEPGVSGNLQVLELDPCIPLFFMDLRGSWESRCKLKRAFRQAECTLLSAEKLATIAHILGARYPEAALRRAWEDLVFTSFHDTLGGSHTDEVYLEAMRRLGAIKDTGHINDFPGLVLDGAVRAIATRIAASEANRRLIGQVSGTGPDSDTGRGPSLTVFNQLSWKRNDICEIPESSVGPGLNPIIERLVAEGASRGGTNPLSDNQHRHGTFACQWRTNHDGFKDLVTFVAGVPSLGYRRLNPADPDAARGAPAIPPPGSDGANRWPRPVFWSSHLAATGRVLENSWWRIELSDAGGSGIPDAGALVSITHIQSGRQYAKNFEWPGNEILARPHDGDLEGTLNLSGEIHRTLGDVSVETEVHVGPVFAEVRSRGKFHAGTRCQSLFLYRDIPRIDFVTSLVLERANLLVSVRFPLAMSDAAGCGAAPDRDIFYETPFAAVRRPKGHYAAQNWVACEQDGAGIALVNTGNPGYWVDDASMELVLLWSVDQRRPPKWYTAPLARELGAHSFRYSLLPYSGGWRSAGIVQQGLEVNNPLLAFGDDGFLRPSASLFGRSRESVSGSGEGPSLPAKASFVTVSQPSFIVTALKLADDGSGDVILRGYECLGTATEVTVTTGFPFESVWATDLLERPSQGPLASDPSGRSGDTNAVTRSEAGQSPQVRQVGDSQLTVSCNGCEIMTLRMKPRAASAAW